MLPTTTAHDSAIINAKERWKTASADHVAATAAVLAAEDALARLHQHIEEAKAKLTTAQSGQRSSILAGFGLGAKPAEPELSVADAQAVVDALESVIPEHEAAITAAQQQHAKTDAATRQAERAILLAKVNKASMEEASAFAAFKAAHLHRLALGGALKDRDLAVMQIGPGYWSSRLYGDRHHIDFTAPGLDDARDALVAQAERGE